MKVGSWNRDRPPRTNRTAATEGEGRRSTKRAEVGGSFVLLHDQGLLSVAWPQWSDWRLKNWRTRGSVAVVAQLGGLAFGDDAARAGVEHDRPVGDREDALQLVRHDHEGEAEVLAQRRIVWSRLAEVIGSRPADGSSRSQDVGPSAIARAMPARFSMPPESSAGMRPRHGPSRPGAAACRAVRFFSASAESVYSSSGKRMFSSTVSEPNSAPLWYITPSLRCRLRRVLPRGASRCLAVDQRCARQRPVEADHVLHQARLAASPSPEDHQISPRCTSNDAFSRRTRSP